MIPTLMKRPKGKDAARPNGQSWGTTLGKLEAYLQDLFSVQ